MDRFCLSAPIQATDEIFGKDSIYGSIEDLARRFDLRPKVIRKGTPTCIPITGDH